MTDEALTKLIPLVDDGVIETAQEFVDDCIQLLIAQRDLDKECRLLQETLKRTRPGKRSEESEARMRRLIKKLSEHVDDVHDGTGDMWPQSQYSLARTAKKLTSQVRDMRRNTTRHR